MSYPTVFYSWQSDRPRDSTRDIIFDAATDAVSRLASKMSLQDSPRLDQDTLGQSGSPAITETIYHKIKQSAVFVADITFIAQTSPKNGQLPKNISNPNVLVELGYAAATIGWKRIILVMNKHYGSPESLPFDLRYRRFPLTFDLGPNSERHREKVVTLEREIEGAIRMCLTVEYSRVDEVLSRLSSYTRSLILKHGGNHHFWETTADNKILSRLDLGISQLLDLDVVRCVEAETDSGLAYEWTYLGRQCALRLGINQPVVNKSVCFEVQPDFPVVLFSPDSITE